MAAKFQTLDELFSEDEAERLRIANTPLAKAEFEASMAISHLKSMREDIAAGFRDKEGNEIEQPQADEPEEEEEEEDEEEDNDEEN